MPYTRYIKIITTRLNKNIHSNSGSERGCCFSMEDVNTIRVDILRGVFDIVFNILVYLCVGFMLASTLALISSLLDNDIGNKGLIIAFIGELVLVWVLIKFYELFFEDNVKGIVKNIKFNRKKLKALKVAVQESKNV